MLVLNILCVGDGALLGEVVFGAVTTTAGKPQGMCPLL